MEVICKEKYNVIFWRNSHDEEWNCEDLDVIINAYQDEPYTEIEYLEPVRLDGTDRILYYLQRCEKCDTIFATLDAEHGYDFCPHCGRAIWSE